MKNCATNIFNGYLSKYDDYSCNNMVVDIWNN